MIAPFNILAQLRRNQVDLPDGGSLDEFTVTRARGVALAIFGGIALIVMAYAGFKYITSQGNPQETAKAQNTIIYAVVGLIVAIFVVTILSFVVNRLFP
jgi:uncharacterized membrane protein YidH (DUF202 family)